MAIRLIVGMGGPARVKRRRSNPIPPPVRAGGFRAEGRLGRGVGVRSRGRTNPKPRTAPVDATSIESSRSSLPAPRDVRGFRRDRTQSAARAIRDVGARSAGRFRRDRTQSAASALDDLYRYDDPNPPASKRNPVAVRGRNPVPVQFFRGQDGSTNRKTVRPRTVTDSMDGRGGCLMAFSPGTP